MFNNCFIILYHFREGREGREGLYEFKIDKMNTSFRNPHNIKYQNELERTLYCPTLPIFYFSLPIIIFVLVILKITLQSESTFAKLPSGRQILTSKSERVKSLSATN